MKMLNNNNKIYSLKKKIKGEREKKERKKKKIMEEKGKIEIEREK